MLAQIKGWSRSVMWGGADQRVVLTLKSPKLTTKNDTHSILWVPCYTENNLEVEFPIFYFPIKGRPLIRRKDQNAPVRVL